MLFKYISSCNLWWPFYSANQNSLCKFSRTYHPKHFYEIILNMDQWLSRFCIKIFLIYSSGSPFFGGQNFLCNLSRGHYILYFCEIIFEFRPVVNGRDIVYRYFLSTALAVSLFGRAEPFVQLCYRAI